MSINNLLDELNDQQRQAVLYNDGPLLILAGAGSGKTKTLTHKIAYILNQKNIDQKNILAVTFTNKAATEMRQRISFLLNQNSINRSFMPYMGTFHGIGVKILRQDGYLIGYDKNFIIFDESDRLSLVKRLLKQKQIDDKSFKPSAITTLISNLKNDPAFFEEKSLSKIEELTQEILPDYERSLKEAGALDFDDLILKLVDLLVQNDSIRDKWRQQFQYILIDEYQDTNLAQYNLIQLLVNDQQQITVVGDDWQSIYSWRGANYKNILKFEKDFKSAKVIKLEQNYRSTSHILNVANHLIHHNVDRSDKNLWTNLVGGLKVKVMQLNNEVSEADMIVRIIKDMVNKSVYKLSDCAILYRTNAQSRALEEAFLRYGLPYQIVGGQKFYDRQEIKDILAYVRLIFQPNDFISFERIINIPVRGIGKKSLANFFEFKDSNQFSLEEALANLTNFNKITKKALSGFQGFHQKLVELKSLKDSGLSVKDFIDQIIKKLDYLNYLDDGSLKGQSKIENVQELLSVAENYGHDFDLFLEEVSLMSDIDRADLSVDQVTLMTIHAAKGLEFNLVFLVGLEESIFPHSRALNSAQELEEERRLCYVAMTRARQQLVLTYTTSRNIYGTLSHNLISRFIKEIVDLEDVDKDASFDHQVTYSYQIPNSQDSFVIEDFEIGDQIFHPIFKEGQIIDLSDNLAAIKFKLAGVKTLDISLAPLKKI